MEKLLFTKKVDKSLLKAGLTIPKSSWDDIQHAVGVKLARGQKATVVIAIGNDVYNATLTHVDMKAADRDVFQIRYSEGSSICTAIKDHYVSLEKAISEKAYIEVWAKEKETLEFRYFPESDMVDDVVSVKDAFFDYLGAPDSLYGYQKSYKLVFYRCFFQEAMYEESIRVDRLTKLFRQFYIDRKRAGLTTEFDGADSFVINPEKGSVDDFTALIMRNPFNAIKKKGFFKKEKVGNYDYFMIQPELFVELNDDDLERIRETVYKKLECYYSKLISLKPETKPAEKNTEEPIGLRTALSRFADDYSAEKKKPMAGNALADFIRHGLPAAFYHTGIVTEEGYKVSGSAGVGAWSSIPWLCVFDRKITESATKGVYIVYLLSKDTNRLYLTLNQGCTDIRKTHNRRETVQVMQTEAEKIRKTVDARGFTASDEIDLGENLNELGILYQKGTIFFKEYQKGQFPSEEELLSDFSNMVQIYSEYANPKPVQPVNAPSDEKAWLLTWNPQNWNWNDYAAGLEASRFDESYQVTWSCSNSHVQPGDRMYLMILGKNGVRGIIAAGKAISKVFEVPHWDYKKSLKGQKTNSVKVSFEKIFDFRADHILKIEDLQSAFPDQKWNPQGSGIEIRSQYVDGLKEMWTNIVHQNDGGDIEGFKDILQNYINGQE